MSAETAVAPFTSLDAMRDAHIALLEAPGPEGPASFGERVELFLRKGATTGGFLDRRDDRRAAQSMLDYWLADRYRAGDLSLDVELAPFDPTQAVDLSGQPCPYVGLHAFDEAQAPLFFGRDTLVNELLERLRAGPLLGVLGSSGSGKSSLVRAGLLPALRAGRLPGSERWIYLPVITPGVHPLAGLEQMVRAALPTLAPNAAARADAWLAAQGRRLTHDPQTLRRMVELLGRRPAVVVVDQMEELLTLCRSDSERQAFADNLLGLLDAGPPHYRLILTIRSDFEQGLARLERFPERFNPARFLVQGLSPAELRAAIEQPAERVGLRFEEGIVDDLVAQIRGELTALPLLQFTLLRLWDAKIRNWVPKARYDELGGGRHALARWADAWYAGLIPEQQRTARRILLRMARPGDRLSDQLRGASEGLEPTSYRVREAALYRSGEDPGRIREVLKKLAEASLVRRTPGPNPDDGQVELAHESLLRNWPRLAGWIDEERAGLRAQIALSEAARQWEEDGRSPDLLWRGRRVRDALALLPLDAATDAFVAAGLAAERQRQVEREAVREAEAARARAEAEAARAEAEVARAEAARIWAEAEAEAARAAEETERERATAEIARSEAAAERTLREQGRRNLRRLGALVAGLAVALLAAVGASLYATEQSRVAEARAAEAATAERAAEQSFATAATDRDIASTSQAQAIAAAARAATSEVNAVGNAALAQTSEANAVAQRQTALAAEQTARANAALAQTAEVQARDAQATSNALATEVAVQRDQLAVQNLQLGQQLQTQQQVATAAAIAAQQAAAAASAVASANASRGTQALTDALEAAQYGPLPGVADALQRAIQLARPPIEHAPGATINAIAWSPRGDWVLTTGSDGVARIWRSADQGSADDLSGGHSGAITVAAWSRDGSWIVTTGEDGLAVVWDAERQARLGIFEGHKSRVLGAAWSPDSSRIVTIDQSKIIIWDATTFAPLTQAEPRLNERVSPAAWSPDGSRFVTFGSQAWVRAAGDGQVVATQPGPWRSAAWGPDGTIALAGAGQVQLWRPNEGQPRTLPVVGSSVAWSRDGRLLLVGGTSAEGLAPGPDRAAQIFDVASGRRVATLVGHGGPVEQALFSPDGGWVALASSRTIRLYQTDFPAIVTEACDWHGQRAPNQPLPVACARVR